MSGGAVASVRLAGGLLCEDVEVPGVGPISVRYERCPAGWSARFALGDPAVADLSVVHRLVAPTLREARRTVPLAVAFLRGEPAPGTP
jgi:hypothetical protein